MSKSNNPDSSGATLSITTDHVIGAGFAAFLSVLGFLVYLAAQGNYKATLDTEVNTFKRSVIDSIQVFRDEAHSASISAKQASMKASASAELADTAAQRAGRLITDLETIKKELVVLLAEELKEEVISAVSNEVFPDRPDAIVCNIKDEGIHILPFFRTENSRESPKYFYRLTLGVRGSYNQRVNNIRQVEFNAKTNFIEKTSGANFTDCQKYMSIDDIRRGGRALYYWRSPNATTN